MVEQVGGNVAWCALHIPAVFNSSSKAAVILAVLFEDEKSRPKAAAAIVALVATFIQR